MVPSCFIFSWLPSCRCKIRRKFAKSHVMRETIEMNKNVFLKDGLSWILVVNIFDQGLCRTCSTVRVSPHNLRHSRQLVSCLGNGLLAAQKYPLALYGTLVSITNGVREILAAIEWTAVFSQFTQLVYCTNARWMVYFMLQLLVT